MKSSGIGGQAVMEGIMMRNGEKYAVAVRMPNQEISVKVEEYTAPAKRPAFTCWPFVRGVFGFVDSLVIGMGTLTYSASFFEEEDTNAKPSKLEMFLTERLGDRLEKVIMGATVCLSLVLAVLLFMVLPVWLASFLRPLIDSQFVITLIEGLLRVSIFIAYVSLISLMEDIRRVYMYHGAEHKCINCIEYGMPLTVENVGKCSRQHKRCGTSFLLIVMVISIFVTMLVQVETVWLRVVSRVILLPVIAGVSYEFLRLAGNSDNALINLLSKPGLALQGMTTKEPDDSMIEVAIASVEAVFDWKKYLNENFGAEYALEEIASTEEAVPSEETET